MTTRRVAVAAVLAARDACQRQAEHGYPIGDLNIDAIVDRVVQDVAGCVPCADDVFFGIAKGMQAQCRCTAAEAFALALCFLDTTRPFAYERWRHGGWYVGRIRYPSGACGCVSSNYPDKRWRIVCDSRRRDLSAVGDVTFRSRDEAARAEQALALAAWEAAIRAAA